VGIDAVSMTGGPVSSSLLSMVALLRALFFRPASLKSPFLFFPAVADSLLGPALGFFSRRLAFGFDAGAVVGGSTDTGAGGSNDIGSINTGIGGSTDIGGGRSADTCVGGSTDSAAGVSGFTSGISLSGWTDRSRGRVGGADCGTVGTWSK
jgi:hypothetical protein